MKALLDSSTLIAAMLPDHAHHAAALAWLARAKAGAFEFVCSAHSPAEVYAVLRRGQSSHPSPSDTGAGGSSSMGETPGASRDS